MTVEAASFEIDNGATLNATNGFAVQGSTAAFDFDGGAIDGVVEVKGATLNDASTNAATFLVHGSSYLNGNISADQTLNIINLPGDTGTTLNAASFTNYGTIGMESEVASYTVTLSVGAGTLTNASTGTLQFYNGGAGTTGDGYFVGNLVNSGTIAIASGSSLFNLWDRTNTYSTSLTMQNGTLTAGGATWLYNGTFNFTGGSIAGDFVVKDSSTYVAATVTSQSTIGITGRNYSHLVSNDSSSVTLWIQGGRDGDDSYLILDQGAVNAGKIVLQTVTGSRISGITTLGTSFDNLATGRIESYLGTGGGRVFYSYEFNNYGVISVANDSPMLQILGESWWNRTATFNMRGGQVIGAGDFRLISGKFNFTGGSITGNFAAENSEVYVASTVTSESVVGVSGRYSSLWSNNSPSVTLWVQGGRNGDHAELYLLQGAVNAGTIILQTTSGAWNSSLNIWGSSFTNLSTGVIESFQGTGGGRVIHSGNGGKFINQGRIAAANGAPVSFSSDFDSNGGSVTGPVNMLISNLYITAVSTSTNILILQSYCTYLQTDVLAGTTIDIQSGGAGQTAGLYSALGFTNYGIIILDSANGSYSSGLGVDGSGLVNAAGGVIYSNVGTGGGRQINAVIDNRGTMNFYANTLVGRWGYNHTNSGTLWFNGTTVTFQGNSWTNTQSGLIDGSGTLGMQWITFTNNGSIVVDGTTAASFTLQGNYTQTTTGSLSLRLFSNGTSATSYDQFIVQKVDDYTGFATLAGTLNAILLNGYQPPYGEDLSVMIFSGATGQFDTVTGLTTGGRQVLQTSYNSADVSLVTIESAVAPNQPQYGSNLGQATVTVNGSSFTSGATVRLVNGSAVRNASSVMFRDQSTLFATFDLTGLTTGQYTIEVLDNGVTTTISTPYTVNNGVAGYLQAQVIGPATIRQYTDGTVRVEYVNAGSTDISAPLLDLAADNALLELLGQPTFDGSDIRFLAINPNGPAGILAPGSRGSFTFVYHPTVSSGAVNFSLSSIGDLTSPMDWTSLETSAQTIAGMADDAWNAVWSNFTSMVGTTVGDYVQMLDNNATYLSELGQYVSDPMRLLGFEFSQTTNALLGAYTVTSVDAVAPSNGISLMFARSFQQTIPGRYSLGTLGRGWTDNWDMSLSFNSSSDSATIAVGPFSAGEQLILYPDGNGNYTTPGANGPVLSQFNGSWKFLQADGSSLLFSNDGQLIEVRDSNGNFVTLGYNGSGQLATLTQSNGLAFTLAYNGQGRLATLTDQNSNVITYTYDSTGELLLQVSGPSGSVSYTYVTGQGIANQYALASVTGSDGIIHTYSYDNRGRIVSETVTGVSDAVTYAYSGPAEVSVTNPVGATTQYFLDDSGLIAQVRSPDLGDLVYVRDANGNVVHVAGPNGFQNSAQYNSLGQPITTTDNLGRQISFTYNAVGNFSTFGNGPNSQSFTYDANGNVSSLTFADGTSLAFQYGSNGELASSTDAMNQQTAYTYNSLGQLTAEQFADGSTASFVYDSRGNLLTATDSQGTITFHYDLLDRVVEVDYPNGQSLQYAYDSAGRPIQLTDQDGNQVNYHYDSAGRLSQLTDGSGNTLVTYTYNPITGFLSRKDQGNGTYTTYSYDSLGRQQGLTNYAADGTVDSFYDYTFDGFGRVATMTTADGVTSYGYDAAGELTSVTLPNGRVIAYTYDSYGNRTSSTDGGVSTDYTVNGASQYTAVGNTNYYYDANGDLIRKVEGDQVWTYSYDSQNRLTGSTGPDGTTTYIYDVFGNRTATVHNGIRTNFLVDLASGNVVSQYDDSGNLQARYAYGLGLTSQISASGNALYYDFDGIGSTVGMTGTAAGYVNQYEYLPFGERLSATEGVSNPFQYVGQAGVMNDPNGLLYMRARYYDPTTGRFIERDPTGLKGGVNQYAYTDNQPTDRVDPQGTSFQTAVAGAVVGTVVNVGFYVFNNQFTDDRTTLQGVLGNAFSGAVAGFLIGGGYSALTQGFIGSAANGIGYTMANGGDGSLGGLGGAFACGFILAPIKWAFPGASTGIYGQSTMKQVGQIWTMIRNGASTGGVAYDVVIGSRLLWNELRLAARVLFFGAPNSRSMWIQVGFASLFSALLSDKVTQIVKSFDPNSMTGPVGPISPASSLAYAISFENSRTATAPVQIVTVNEQLDPSLDPLTFSFGSYGWGNLVFHAPAGVTSFHNMVDLRNTIGLFVEVDAYFDPTTRRLAWTFKAIDPKTMQVPTDAETGFLPANTADRIGEGFISYTVEARSTVKPGDVIYAQASITFDRNDPMNTPRISNTIASDTIGVLPTERRRVDGAQTKDQPSFGIAGTTESGPNLPVFYSNPWQELSGSSYSAPLPTNSQLAVGTAERSATHSNFFDQHSTVPATSHIASNAVGDDPVPTGNDDEGEELEFFSLSCISLKPKNETHPSRAYFV